MVIFGSEIYDGIIDVQVCDFVQSLYVVGDKNSNVSNF